MIGLLLGILSGASLQVVPGPPRQIDCGSGTERARTALVAADRARAARDWRTADHLLEAGLQALGNSYRQPGMIDDSASHLVLAGIATRERRFKDGTSIRRRVLFSRLRFCALHAGRVHGR